MATIKKSMSKSTTTSQTTKKPTPTYKNLRMGVNAQYENLTGETRSNIKPTGKDSADYRGGFEIGLKNRGKKNIKPVPGENPVQRGGRWEGQNIPQKKKGGAVKKKMQAGGVKSKSVKAPNKKGAFIDVQNRTLGSMKKGGKVAKRMSKMSKKK